MCIRDRTRGPPNPGHRGPQQRPPEGPGPQATPAGGMDLEVRAALVLRGLRGPSHQLVFLGVLVLLVAVAVALGGRGSGDLESAQPHADAATSQSAAVTVPATR